MAFKKGAAFEKGGSSFRVLEYVPNPKREAVARRAAALANQLQAIMGPFEAMMYLGELALACIVSGRTGRASFEKRLGERVPAKLWRKLERFAAAPVPADASSATVSRGRRAGGRATAARRVSARQAQERRFTLPFVALGCVAARKGARQVLERRVNPPLTEKDWAQLEREVLVGTPRLEKRWRQMRAAGMVSFPESLPGTDGAIDP